MTFVPESRIWFFHSQASIQLRKGDLVRVTEDYHGPAYFEMVKKARRQRSQFKVGQVITSDTLREVMWVRGTVIERDDNRHAAFVLREDGKWHDLLGDGCECKAGWSFEDFQGDYRLARLP